MPRETIYWDRKCQPITAHRWDELLAKPAYRRVAEWQRGHTRVLTEWMGFVHGLDVQGRPEIFRTLVYIDGTLDDVGGWYATEPEACAGHVVECLKREGVLT